MAELMRLQRPGEFEDAPGDAAHFTNAYSRGTIATASFGFMGMINCFWFES